MDDRHFCERVILTQARGWYTVRMEGESRRDASKVINFGNRPQDAAFYLNVKRHIEGMGYASVLNGTETRFRLGADRAALADDPNGPPR